MKFKLIILILMFSFCFLFSQNDYYLIKHTGTSSGNSINGQLSNTVRFTSGNPVSLTIKVSKYNTYNAITNSQSVTSQSMSATPTTTDITTETDDFGNEFYLVTWDDVQLNQLYSADLSCNLSTDTNLSILQRIDDFPIPLSNIPVDVRQFLEPTDDIQSEHTNIINQANTIVSGCSDLIHAIKEIICWVRANVTYVGGVSNDALSVLSSGQGNCTGFTNLTIALLRASGVPAKFIGSIILPKVYNVPLWGGTTTPFGSSGPGLHATLEFYLPSQDNWISGDSQSFLFYINQNILKVSEGDEMVSQCSYSWSYSGNLPTYDSLECNLSSASISSISITYDYIGYEIFGNGPIQRAIFSCNYEPSTNIDNLTINPSFNKLYCNFPNPFNPSTTISYNLADNIQNPQIEIFNIKGQKVRNFQLENTIGENSIVWNGKDANDKSVSSGVYFYQLMNEGKIVQSRKMLMIK